MVILRRPIKYGWNFRSIRCNSQFLRLGSWGNVTTPFNHSNSHFGYTLNVSFRLQNLFFNVILSTFKPSINSLLYDSFFCGGYFNTTFIEDHSPGHAPFLFIGNVAAHSLIWSVFFFFFLQLSYESPKTELVWAAHEYWILFDTFVLYIQKSR